MEEKDPAKHGWYPQRLWWLVLIAVPLTAAFVEIVPDLIQAIRSSRNTVVEGGEPAESVNTRQRQAEAVSTKESSSGPSTTSVATPDSLERPGLDVKGEQRQTSNRNERRRSNQFTVTEGLPQFIDGPNTTVAVEFQSLGGEQFVTLRIIPQDSAPLVRAMTSAGDTIDFMSGAESYRVQVVAIDFSDKRIITRFTKLGIRE